MHKNNYSSLKYRLAFFIGILFLFIMLGIMGVFIIHSRKTEKEKARENLIFNVNAVVENISNEIDLTSRQIDLSIKNLKKLRKVDGINREFLISMFQMQMLLNPSYFGVCTVWEPGKFDNLDKQYKNVPGYYNDGRFTFYWYRENDSIMYDDSNISWEEEAEYGTEWYDVPKETRKPYIFLDLYPIKDVEYLMISLCVPIIENNQFLGIYEVDYNTDFIQQLTVNLKNNLYNGKANLRVISHTGEIAAHADVDSLVGANLAEIAINEWNNLQQNFSSPKPVYQELNDTVVYMAPIYFKGIDHVWLFEAKLPKKVIMAGANKLLLWQIVVGFVVLLLVILIIIYVVGKELQPLLRLTESTYKISKGNLVIALESNQKGEIGKLTANFKLMLKKLNQMVDGIKTEAFFIHQGSESILSNALIIADGANKQATAIEEINSSLGNILIRINENVEHAQLANKEAVESENSILKQQQEENEVIALLNHIVKKIAIINDISRKTDILAINAAIEAARSGENGGGFAVVAAEIRKLAENSQAAAVGINELIDKSLKISTQSKQHFSTIVSRVQNSGRLVKLMAEMNLEQQSAIKQINTAIQELNNVAAANIRTSEDMSLSSNELKIQAQHLSNTIDFFTTK